MRYLAFAVTALLFFQGNMTNAAPQPTPTTPEQQALHLGWLNKSISPEQNFFGYANGTWQKTHPIPSDHARWGTFQILEEQNIARLNKLMIEIEKANPKSDTDAQKIGDLYFSGMDEKNINKLGASPLTPEFERINSIKSIPELQQVIAHLQTIGVDAPFSFGQMQDYKDNTQVIGVASQSGLGLPDRDYYLKPDKQFKKIRQVYVNHITNMLKLLGDNPKQAAIEANTIMRIETQLAKSSMSVVEQRDPLAVYHMKTLTELQQATPNFNWKNYFTDIKHPDIDKINLAMPNFFKFIDTALKTISIEDWKIYLRWHLIDSLASCLSDNFVNEQFKMSSALTGTKSLPPRWKRVVASEDALIGFAVGKLYVEKYFPPSSKEAAQQILDHIREALKNDLTQLPWMTPDTRKAAIYKLEKMEGRIGYPEKWRDYSSLKIDRGPYVLNVVRANEFLSNYELNKIGKPVDKNEWEMTPQTINAYYDPSLNQLNIPAGILQPPFFDPHAPDAVNYGGIGFVMGHEMTHGFDDEGAQFDATGNLKNWWTANDLNKFHALTNCIVTQFSKYTVNGNLHLQGKLVVGEATADLGGLILAYKAFQSTPGYKDAKTIDGFTPTQQFFLSAAHVWAMNIEPKEEMRLAITNPHPPAKYRVNGTLANMPEFQQAFHITDSGPMVNKKICIIW